MSIQVLCPFLNWIIWGVFLLLSCMSSLYVLDISPLSGICLQLFPPYSVGCLFILLTVSVAVQKLFSLFIFAFLACALGDQCQGTSPAVGSFMISGLTCKSLIHFELVL